MTTFIFKLSKSITHPTFFLGCMATFDVMLVQKNSPSNLATKIIFLGHIVKEEFYNVNFTAK